MRPLITHFEKIDPGVHLGAPKWLCTNYFFKVMFGSTTAAGFTINPETAGFLPRVIIFGCGKQEHGSCQPHSSTFGHFSFQELLSIIKNYIIF
jgi:hypothetical protein